MISIYNMAMFVQLNLVDVFSFLTTFYWEMEKHKVILF